MKLSSSYKDRTAGINFTRVSDHFPCFLGFKLNKNVDIKRARYIKRVHTNKALQNFRSDIEKSNIFDLLGHDPYQDPNTNYNILHDKLMKLKEKTSLYALKSSINIGTRAINGLRRG